MSEQLYHFVLHLVGQQHHQAQVAPNEEKKRTQHHANYMRVANALSQPAVQGPGHTFCLPIVGTIRDCVAVGSVDCTLTEEEEK